MFTNQQPCYYCCSTMITLNIFFCLQRAMGDEGLVRERRAAANVSQLRELLQELLDTDPAFRQMLQGPQVPGGRELALTAA